MKRRKTIKRILAFVLYGACILWLVHQLRGSGMQLDWRDNHSWMILGAAIGVSSLMALFDSLAWRAALRASTSIRPSLRSLVYLRIAGDAVTNAVPGGFILGETIKALRLRDWSKIPVVESAPSLLFIKFGLGYSQALFIFVGLILGFGLSHPVALGSLALMCTVMALPLALLWRGSSFVTVGNILQRHAWGRKLVAPRAASLAKLDERCSALMRRGPGLIGEVLAWLLFHWLTGVVETMLILSAIGTGATWQQAFVIESLGSMFRLLFFIVPSGVGGQDASFFALFRIYDLSNASAGVFIAFKRSREVFWIALGFVLVFLSRRSKKIDHVTISKPDA